MSSWTLCLWYKARDGTRSRASFPFRFLHNGDSANDQCLYGQIWTRYARYVMYVRSDRHYDSLVLENLVSEIDSGGVVLMGAILHGTAVSGEAVRYSVL